MVRAGVYYGAGPSEALACSDSRVLVAGGGTFADPAVAPPIHPSSVGKSPHWLAVFPQTGSFALTNQPVVPPRRARLGITRIR